ncbi:MAG: RNA polymerase sigma factor [Candidatus Aminicenantia bacterium]
MLILMKDTENENLKFESLIRQYEKYIYNLLFQLAGNQAEAKDLAQETFIQVYKKLNTFRNEGSLKSWITRIAINCFRMSKRAKPPHVSINLGELVIPDSSGNPERVAIKREMQWCITHTLQQHIPKKYRLVLVLRDLQEMSYSEIAQILNLPISTVKIRLHRARKAFRDHFIKGGCKAFVSDFSCFCQGIEKI